MIEVSTKGALQKLLSGFCPLRGGEYPPFPLRVFGQDDFPLRGGGGYPPIPLRKIPLKSRYFRSQNCKFCLFSFIFSAFWSNIWPFWSIFKLILYKNIIFSPFRKIFSGKA